MPRLTGAHFKYRSLTFLNVMISFIKGFWDMILIQIEDTKSKFRELEKLEADGWVHPKGKSLFE